MSRLIPAALEKRYQAANDHVTAAIHLPAADDTARIAKHRALVAAWGVMVDVYAEAQKLPTLHSPLLWSALFDAGSNARNRRAEAERALAALGGEL